MRSVTSSLIRLAAISGQEEGPIRSLFGALAKAAGVLEDIHARASYLEGLLGFSPGAISRNERKIFADARAALESGLENRIVDVLRYEFKMSEEDIVKMVSARDTGIYNALDNGVRSTFGNQSFRGMIAEDITMALLAGVSPLTNDPLKYGPGRGVFHWLGKRAMPAISIKGIKAIAYKEARNRALDIIRGTREEERNQLDLNSPEVEDFIDHEPTGGANYAELAHAIYADPWVMHQINNIVKNNLTTPTQEAVWQAVLNNPDLLQVDPSGIGVQAKQLAIAVCKIMGAPNQGKSTEVSVGKTFRLRVLPAMVEALANSEVAKRLLQKRHIMEIIQEAQRRPPKTRFNVPIPFAEKRRPKSPVKSLPVDSTMEVSPTPTFMPPTSKPLHIQAARYLYDQGIAIGPEYKLASSAVNFLRSKGLDPISASHTRYASASRVAFNYWISQKEIAYKV